MSDNIKKLIADQFLEIADALETGSFGKKPLIGIVVSGTEHGMENILEGARLAEKAGIRTVVIDGEDAHKKM
ncbi:MAG: glycine reductase, partial [Firmicutes bacterium]|nr:glycine reductase [Bacillota bacterium]